MIDPQEHASMPPDQGSEGHEPKSREFAAAGAKMFLPVLIVLAVGVAIIVFLVLS